MFVLIGPLTNVLPKSSQQAHQPHYFQLQHQQKQQQYRKQLSQSFRDILENTLLINGMCEPPSCVPPSPAPPSNVYQAIHQRNQSTGFLDCGSATPKTTRRDETVFEPALAPSSPPSTTNTPTPHRQQFSSPTRAQANTAASSASPSVPGSAVSTSQVPTTPVLVNTQLAIKFAQLEHTLAITKAENNNLLEQQVSIYIKSFHFSFRPGSTFIII